MVKKVVRFDITRSLWDLWKLLEGEGVKDVYIDEFRPIPEVNYIEVVIVDDEAGLRVPKWVLRSDELMELLETFVTAYRGTHTDWEEEIRKDYEMWLEHLKRIWVRHGLSPEEAEKRKAEYLKALEETIKKEAKEMVDFSKFAYSLLALKTGKKKRKPVLKVEGI
jgi:hypothetical protein